MARDVLPVDEILITVNQLQKRIKAHKPDDNYIELRKLVDAVDELLEICSIAMRSARDYQFPSNSDDDE